MKTFNFILALSTLAFVNMAYAEPLVGLVKNQGDTFNFELAGQKNWDYDLKRIKDKNQTKIQLFLKAGNKETLEKITNIENPFVQSIQVKPPVDGKWVVEFVLKNDQVESFDYLTDQPSKLIVDFYVNESANQKPAVAEGGSKKPAVKGKDKSKKETVASSGGSSEGTRKPAEADYLKIDEPGGIETSALLKSGLTDGADSFFSRFVIKDVEINERSILKSDNNYYLNFPMLENEFLFWNTMKKNPPVYQFKDKNTDENKQAQLLKTLFNKKRYLVFKQTAEWFENKYPESEYLESIAFMKADAYAELWRTEKNDKFYELAQFSYLQALGKYPKSALAERTSLMLGLLAIDKLDYMMAIRRFTNHIEDKNYKGRISQDYARLGLGYSFSKIKRLNDAVAEMNSLEKDSKNPLVKAESAFRRADFYFDAKKYDQAIANYKEALKKYPTLAHLFPNAQFNSMESNFWQKQYKEAHADALEFAQKFPGHAYAPYALTRVGELLDILGADHSRAVGSLLETYFRYGESPKTIVARLHLLSTRMKGMKEEELKQTIAKMEELAAKSDLVNVDQFKVTMIADGFTRRGDYNKAIEILSDFFQKNPNRSDARQVTRRIVRNIFEQIQDFSDKGKHRDVLATFQKYSDTWLKHQDRIDTDYLLGLAYESAGDYPVALEKFNKTLGSMLAVKGTPKEKWISVTENLPPEDSLHLRIAQGHFQNKDYQKAYEQLQQIKNPQKLTEPDQILRVQLASELYEKKGDSETALRYLTELVRVWNGKPEFSVEVLLRLAEMQSKKSDTEGAKESLQKILKIAEESKKVNPRFVIKAGNMLADLHVAAGRPDDAAKSYIFILDKYDETHALSEERYKLGEIYYRRGELKKAETTWAKLKGEKAAVWSKLAENKVKDAQWSDEYKKYLKRIPAMSQLESKE